LAKLIAVRQWLGPRRIDFELRRHHTARGLCGHFGELVLAHAEHSQQRHQRRADHDIAFRRHIVFSLISNSQFLIPNS
jgi:hypothetical protein